jgi:oxygen-dependent protoporphyrinogen oxidase
MFRAIALTLRAGLHSLRSCPSAPPMRLRDIFVMAPPTPPGQEGQLLSSKLPAAQNRLQESPAMPEAIVVGAGITGLACAHALKKLGIDTLVVESSDRVGGVIRSERIDGYLVEWGPTSLLPTSHTFDLIDEIGLSAELVQADPKSPRYVSIGGELKRVPFGPLTARGIFRALSEPFVRSKSSEEESVAQFFRRRIGTEAHDRLIAPLVTGIYAGDSEKLGISATFPRLVEIEREYGSMMIGMLRAPKKSGGGRPSVVSSFPNGMETLPMRLAEGLQVQLGSKEVRIGRTVEASVTIVTTPSYAAAEIVEPFSADLAALLREVQYAPMVVAAASIAQSSLGVPIRGFGFLVPPSERMNILGSVFNSSLFPDRAPAGHELVTTFVGGALKPEALDWPDARLWDVVGSDLKRILKLSEAPTPVKVVRHRHAVPQYPVDHLKWKRAVDAELKRCRGLFLVGSYLEGVSVPACMELAEKTAHAAHDYIRSVA